MGSACLLRGSKSRYLRFDRVERLLETITCLFSTPGTLSNPTSRPSSCLVLDADSIAVAPPHRCTIKQETSMNSGHEPATKADLEELRADVKQDLEGSRGVASRREAGSRGI